MGGGRGAGSGCGGGRWGRERVCCIQVSSSNVRCGGEGGAGAEAWAIRLGQEAVSEVVPGPPCFRDLSRHECCPVVCAVPRRENLGIVHLCVLCVLCV